MHEDIEIGEIGKRASSWLKEHIEPHRFSPDRRWLSMFILDAMFLFTYLAFAIPEPSYSQFCSHYTADPSADNHFTSPADVFKYALCRSGAGDVSRQAVSYVLHPIFFTAKAFLFFIAGILAMYFLKKDKEMIMQGILYAIAFFFWALALMLYVSTYTGWF